MTLSRRSFLRQATLGTALLPSVLRAKEDEIPIFDTHVHLWDLKQFKLPWLKRDAPFAKDFLISDYEKATEGCGVKKAIYMEVDVASDQKQDEADWIRNVCKEGKSVFVGAVIGGDPSKEEFKKYATQFKGDPYIKGIRQVLHADSTPQGYGLKKEFVSSVQVLGELGLTFDLCMRHQHLSDAIELAEKCPGTTFVLDHCGNPNMQAKDHTQWKKDIEKLAKLKNTIGKISGILFTLKPGKWVPEDLAPVINHCLDSFGPDRVIFASDWPVCTNGGTFKEWLHGVQTIVKNRKAEEQKKLFYDNAIKLYGLKG